MNRVTKTIVLAVAALFVISAVAFACGENAKSAEKATTETSAKMASSSSTKTGGCPLAGTPACGASGTTTAQTAGVDSKLLRTISIKGMTCTGCESGVSAALTKVPGVVEVVSISYEKGEATVKIDPARLNESELITAVSSKGYEAKVIPAVATSTEAGSTCGLSAKNTVGKASCEGSAQKASEEKKPEETK